MDPATNPGVKLDGWVKTHKPQAAAAGLAIVAGAVYWQKHRAAAQTGNFTTPTTAAGTIGAAPYDSSANDVYNSVESVLEQLQNTANQISTTGAAGNQPTPVTDTPPVAVTTPVLPFRTVDPIAGSLPTYDPARPLSATNAPATTGSVSAQQSQQLWPAATPSVISAPVIGGQTQQPGQASVNGNWLVETYIGNDGKQYTEQIPNTTGNQTALQKQGFKLS